MLKKFTPFAIGLSLFGALIITVCNAPAAHAASFSVTIQNTVGEGGAVTGGGVTCASSTQQYCFATGDTTTLPLTFTAASSSGMVFTGWGSSDCTPSGNTCTFTTATANANYTVYPNWDHASYTETVSKIGSGSGTITASSGSINCGGVCSATYTTGTDFTLTATPAAGSVFAGWDTSGNLCLTGSKATITALTTTTCPVHVAYMSGTAVARFDKAATTTAPTSPSAPAATPTPKAATPTPSPQSTATPSPTSSSAAANTSTKLEVNGQPASGSNPTVKAGQTLVLKGVAAPNAIVKLYIFSTPRQATVTADVQGNWSYKIEGLEPGSHHVESEATDPVTHHTTPRTTIATFTIAAASTAAPKAASALSVSFWVATGLAAMLVVGGGLWWWRRSASAITPSNSGL